ncbi:MAG: lytic transglycosylase domain-containing protein [Rudaea sp.]
MHPSRPFLRYGFLSRAAAALAFVLGAAPASADLWAYVDPQGRSHVADHRVDARYTLFFKGATTLDVRNAEAAARARAIDELAGTPLYGRAVSAAAHAYDALIERHARANGLDPELVRAVIAVESGFDPGAISDKGAIGLMQVLPETGARYGVAADARRSVADKLRDPAINVRIGARYLRDLLARFPESLTLALAAYNAGEGTVATHRNNVPPFPETRDYVRRVQQVYALYRPAQSTPATPVRIIDPRKTSARERAQASP